MKLSRRHFARGLGISGILAAGFVGYKATKEKIVYKQDELPTAELEKQIESKPVLALMATYGEEIKPPPNTFIFAGHGPTYKEGTQKNVEVRIVPGPDGKLYVKENDVWRKI
jgi:hypothetical protein